MRKQLTVRYESWKKVLACSYVHTFSMQTCSRVEPAAFRFWRWISKLACCLSKNTAWRKEFTSQMAHPQQTQAQIWDGACLASYIQLPANKIGFNWFIELLKFWKWKLLRIYFAMLLIYTYIYTNIPLPLDLDRLKENWHLMSEIWDR